MPNVGCHVPDDWPWHDQLADRAKTFYAGKVSSYVRALLEDDLAGSRDVDLPRTPTPVTSLAARLCGELDAERWKALLAGRDEREVMRDILASELARRTGPSSR